MELKSHILCLNLFNLFLITSKTDMKEQFVMTKHIFYTRLNVPECILI